jgi:hypothetical protein
VNGGFDTGDFDGWTTGGNDGFTGVEDGYGPSGGYAAYIGPIGSDFDLSQNIATIPGDTYQIEFTLENLGGTPNDFSVSFGSDTLLSLVNTSEQPYTEYTYDVTATSSSTDLMIAGRQDPTYWYLADVSVVLLNSSMVNAGLMEATNHGTLDLQNSIDNTGVGPSAGILIDGTSTLLVDTSDLQLTGSGTVTLESGSQIEGNGSSASPDTLENVNNTIEGAGTIGTGDGKLALENDTAGIIDANVANHTLTIDTGNDITNAGLLEATGGGTLQINDPVNNSGGTIEVDSTVASSTVDIASGVSGGTVEFVNGSSTYGELVLSDPSQFSATITGFGGHGSPATSDTIDLVGVPEQDVSISQTGPGATAVVTVTDPTPTTITIVDPEGEVLEQSDDSGDTLIYDPPATRDHGHDRSSGRQVVQGDDQFSLPPDGQNSHLTGVSLSGAGSDSFMFHSISGSDATWSAHPQSSTTQIGNGGSLPLVQTSSDNFFFSPGLGADTGNLNPPSEATQPSGANSAPFNEADNNNLISHPDLGAHTGNFEPSVDPVTSSNLATLHYVALHNATHLH